MYSRLDCYPNQDRTAMENNEIDLSETNGASLISVVVVLLTLSWISVVLRTYTRAVLMKGFQWDDWIMLLAQVWPSIPYTHTPSLSQVGDELTSITFV